ncbi:MAG: UbiA family prenyltransferase [Thermoleophilia bacterium]
MFLILQSLRPRQWIKNLVVFAGLIFSRNVFNGPMQIKVWLTFISFCGIVSAGYLINDIIDRESDRLHPKKKFRPIASGSLKPKVAVFFAVVLVVFSFALSFAVDYSLPLFLLSYFVLQMLYTGFLKHLVIIDVLAINSIRLCHQSRCRCSSHPCSDFSLADCLRPFTGALPRSGKATCGARFPRRHGFGSPA